MAPMGVLVRSTGPCSAIGSNGARGGEIAPLSTTDGTPKAEDGSVLFGCAGGVFSSDGFGRGEGSHVLWIDGLQPSLERDSGLACRSIHVAFDEELINVDGCSWIGIGAYNGISRARESASVNSACVFRISLVSLWSPCTERDATGVWIS